LWCTEIALQNLWCTELDLRCTELDMYQSGIPRCTEIDMYRIGPTPFFRPQQVHRGNVIIIILFAYFTMTNRIVTETGHFGSKTL